MNEEQNFITVSQFGNYIKSIFDNEEMLHNIAIFGEISAYKLYRGDTAYFTIKDENAMIECVLFGANRLEVQPQIGESVIVKGSPSYYVKGGKFSFNVRNLIAYGKGALYLKFLQLKEKLQKEGLFDDAHKMLVPNNAINIGVVTSLQGAVLQDIKNIAFRRNCSVNLYVYGCRVQGLKADDTIIKGIRELDKMGLDAIIVARGGGSSEDLDCFNSEALARAVYECQTPIVSAVGHETDFTIIDFVADKRAPTPSAAAELIVANVAEYRRLLLNILARMNGAMLRECQEGKAIIDLCIQRINNKLINFVDKSLQELNFTVQTLYRFESEYLLNLTNKLNLLSQGLEKINPLIIMRRGYARVETESNQVISSVKDLNIGQKIKVHFQDGVLMSKIEEIKEGENRNEI